MLTQLRSTVTTVALAMLLLAMAIPALAQPEPVTLRYFTWDGGLESQQIREDLIEPFQELYPHITIEHEAVPFSQFFDKLTTYIAGGEAPDLIHMSVGYVYDFADLGLLLNLQPYFDRDLNPDDFFMEPFKAMRYPSMETGDLYGIPFAFVMSAFYYNETLFDVTGLAYPDESWTWENVREAGKRIAHDTDGDGVIDRWGFHANFDYKLLDMVIHAFGGRILDEDHNVLVDQPEAVRAAQFLVDMIHEDQIAPGIRANGNNLFQQGQLAMHVTNIFDLQFFRDTMENDWNVALMPAGPAQRVVRLWPTASPFPRVPGIPGSLEFIKFVITGTRWTATAAHAGYRSTGACHLPEWLEPDQRPDKMIFIQQVAYGHPLEFRPNWGEWNSARNAALQPAFLGEEPVQFGMEKWAQAIRNAIGQ